MNNYKEESKERKKPVKRAKAQAGLGLFKSEFDKAISGLKKQGFKLRYVDDSGKTKQFEVYKGTHHMVFSFNKSRPKSDRWEVQEWQGDFKEGKFFGPTIKQLIQKVNNSRKVKASLVTAKRAANPENRISAKYKIARVLKMKDLVVKVKGKPKWNEKYKVTSFPGKKGKGGKRDIIIYKISTKDGKFIAQVAYDRRDGHVSKRVRKATATSIREKIEAAFGETAIRKK